MWCCHLDFSGHASWKGRHQTMPLVFFVYVCSIFDYMPFKDDVEYLARPVTDIAIIRGNILRLHRCRINLIELADWLKSDSFMPYLAT